VRAAKLAAENSQLSRASEEYGFQTYEGEAFGGQRVMLARDVAQLMYGANNVTNLRKLMSVYGLDFLRLGGDGSYYHRLLKDHFGLSKFDSEASFGGQRVMLARDLAQLMYL